MFLTDLTVNRQVASSTQNQAFNALLFLYKHVFKIDDFGNIDAKRAKLPERLFVVLYEHKEYDWQYIFPSYTLSVDPRSGITQRHHLHLSSLNRSIRKVGKLSGSDS